ncbi:YaaC family protein [Cytobacillus sp. FSL R5-0596]|uniref:YaaC family protein n=1 Tax=Cytobacillus sp. FSL R5-0596 TaxID=2954696 RepID=UPI0030F580B0
MVWEKLYLYESQDLIARLFQEKHARGLSSKKAKEIISHFVQGREYFKSAKQSAEVVRPLLLYYGVLSLSRGLILFLDAKSSESSLKSGHGIGVHQWNETLAKGLDQLTNVMVKFNKGTFSELLTVTRNSERWRVNTAPFPSSFLGETNLELDLKEGFSITLDDILSRIPELSESYTDVFNKLPNCYEANIFILDENTHTDISLVETTKGMPDEAEIRKMFNISRDVTFTYRNQSHFLPNLSHMEFRINHQNKFELENKLPHIKNIVNNHNCYIIAPLEDGIRFSSLMTLFILSYFTGMLVRYYPSQWQSLINRSKGDIAFPILIKAINLLEEKFPSLIIDELTYGESYYK